MNFNYCYKITYESGETYDRRRNELSVEISKEDYKKIITGVLQERPIEQIEGISDVIDKKMCIRDSVYSYAVFLPLLIVAHNRRNKPLCAFLHP